MINVHIYIGSGAIVISLVVKFTIARFIFDDDDDRSNRLRRYDGSRGSQYNRGGRNFGKRESEFDKDGRDISGMKRSNSTS